MSSLLPYVLKPNSLHKTNSIVLVISDRHIEICVWLDFHTRFCFQSCFIRMRSSFICFFFYNFILINIRFGLSHRIVVGCNYLTKGRGEGEYRNEMRDNWKLKQAHFPALGADNVQLGRIEISILRIGALRYWDEGERRGKSTEIELGQCDVAHWKW